MSNARSAWTQAMLDTLADGHWHDIDDVIRVGMPLVPPGVAYRTGERYRRYRSNRPRIYGGAAAAVQSGARYHARNSLVVQVQLGHVERDRDQIRIARRHR